MAIYTFYIGLGDADLNVQSCRKSNFRHLENGIQLVLGLFAHFSLFHFTSSTVQISYFYPPPRIG